MGLMNFVDSSDYRTFAMTTRYLMNQATSLARQATGKSEPEITQLTPDEQIERARHAAARMDAGYYFSDDELDDETLTCAPHRPQEKVNNEWL